MDQPSKTSFGIYESLRILVPGFYFATLAFFFYRCSVPPLIPIGLSKLSLVLLYFFFGILAGFSLYAQETAKRRKAFLENQPSRYISDKARTMKNMPLIDDDAARKLYFYILNNHMPASFHEKIFFFGTIYHIMINIRRTSFWFAVLAAGTIALDISRGVPLAELQGLLVFTLYVWLMYGLNVRYNKADRKMQENYQDQIFWLQMNGDVVESTLRTYRDVTTPHR